MFLFQDQGLSFGMRVLPCNDEPGVQIFGYAPQFSAKNFSHVFSHEDQYDIPGKNNLKKSYIKPNCHILFTQAFTALRCILNS